MCRHPMHEANRRGWDAAAAQWQAGIDAKVDWRGIPGDIRIALDDVELKYLGDVSGRFICVLGSGDNLVAFALADAGARVTSVDISQAQLDIAAGRAEELGLSIAFHRADVTELGGLGGPGGPGGPGDASGSSDTSGPDSPGDPDEPTEPGDPDDHPGGGFDIVYTGGHVAVWVSDLKRYYGEAIRILKPGGLFMVNEYHPFRRIWKHSAGPLKQEYHYFDHGPLAYDRSEDLSGDPGPLPSYEFHWTVSDMVRAMLDGGCELTAMEEYGDGRQDWEGEAPLENLPANLLLVGRKKPLGREFARLTRT
ncbi:MAG: class I SAM-dependent methyltransferase [Gemmatimonadetes bacterium]|nr:class I SAM-dependent methyltransferase [Gemmatimonadota bacterium]MYD24652.1 class I SAM-dependent methyltransferase [Gemmatimonadota bacterium]MYI98597.1 class I SAM-dependent methyltransferase [Gemmatimonadota bacterium]